MSGLPFEFPKTESRYLAKARGVAGTLRRRFGLGVPATDIVHDVMIEAIEEQQRTGLKAKGFWPRLVNKVFDNYRRDQVHIRMLVRRAGEQRNAERRNQVGALGENEAIARELRETIESAVAELSQTDQDIWRRLNASESYIEIAEALGKSKDAVKQAVYRIRAHIRNRMPIEYQ